MRTRSKFAIAAMMALGMLAAIALVAGTGGDETRDAIYAEQNRPAWVNENGIWDMSKAPATEGVMDSTGAVVGYVKTSERELYPKPVYGSEGNLIGHIGENGYWALGEPEPYIPDAYTVIEEFDANGERTRHEIIRAIEPEPGEEGPTGNTN